VRGTNGARSPGRVVALCVILKSRYLEFTFDIDIKVYCVLFLFV
jgi:hypothetical protein